MLSIFAAKTFDMSDSISDVYSKVSYGPIQWTTYRGETPEPSLYVLLLQHHKRLLPCTLGLLAQMAGCPIHLAVAAKCHCGAGKVVVEVF